MSLKRTLVLLVVASAAAPAAAGASETPADAPDVPPAAPAGASGAAAPDEVLVKAPAGGPSGQIGQSDELRVTRIAYAAESGVVRAAPSATARRVTGLRLLGPDGLPESYLILSTWKDSRDREWSRIKVPLPRRVVQGWVRSSELVGRITSRTAVKIDRKALKLTAFRDGKAVMTARVGVGRPGRSSPAGRFWIRDRFKLKTGGVYGPLAYTLSANGYVAGWPGGAVVAIHGTNQPGFIPGRPSNGCIRLRNADVLRLGRIVGPGTAVHIV